MGTMRLAGAGWVVLGDDCPRLPLDADHLATVAPQVSRTLASGPAGLRVLIVGAPAGRPYEPPAWSSG